MFIWQVDRPQKENKFQRVRSVDGEETVLGNGEKLRRKKERLRKDG
jgi:hypothetical protein